jgi:hypothetical protein
MRWTIPITVAASVLLIVAAGLFVFVSHATQDVSVTCDVPDDVPWEVDGRLVPLPYGSDAFLICREQTRYWWQ